MKLLTTQQAADLLGINLNNISLRCRQGKIPGAVQIGGRWLIPEEALSQIEVHPNKKNKRYCKKSRPFLNLLFVVKNKKNPS